jgi:transposase
LRKAAQVGIQGEDIDGPLLSTIDVGELMEMPIPPLEPIMEPWLNRQSLGMIHAWRGTGKSWFTLWLAYCVAAGQDFLGWRVPKPQPVLYLDGEMQATVMQERLRQIRGALGITPAPGLLRILTPDLQERSLPNLADPGGQFLVDEQVRDAQLVIVDNLSSLVRHAEENDAASWLEVATWSLRLRRERRAILFVHHTGKGGKQRGTSKREDLLDVVIHLKHPGDYTSEQGARFEVRFEKARAVSGKQLQSFETQLRTDERGRLAWATSEVTLANDDRIGERWDLGMTPNEIAVELAVDRSTVYRALNRLQDKTALQREFKPKSHGKSHEKARDKQAKRDTACDTDATTDPKSLLI